MCTPLNQYTLEKVMKTTIEIRDELFYKAKEVALQRRTTFRAIIEEALVIAVEEEKPVSDAEEKQRLINELKETGIEFDASGFPYLANSAKNVEDAIKNNELNDDLNRAFGFLSE